MAKKMKVEEVAHISNAVGFNKDALKQAMEELMTKREDIASENQAAGVIVKNLVKDHGVNDQGFKLGVKFMKMSPEARTDVLRTFFACLEAAEMMPKPDLVDLMETC